MYIDPLLLGLSKSGYECHLDGLYTGPLSCADDITTCCPSIVGLNKMLKICSKFALHNSIMFTSKKTVCIKFGDKIIEGPNAISMVII